MFRVEVCKTVELTGNNKKKLSTDRAGSSQITRNTMKS